MEIDEAKKAELSRDWLRFMIIGGFLYSIFQKIIEKNVGMERMPFRYFVLSGVLSLVVEVALYYSIRNWPGRRKTAVVWAIGFLFIGVCLIVGK